jgi:hypothetical protein
MIESNSQLKCLHSEVSSSGKILLILVSSTHENWDQEHEPIIGSHTKYLAGK